MKINNYSNINHLNYKTVYLVVFLTRYINLSGMEIFLYLCNQNIVYFNHSIHNVSHEIQKTF